MVLNLGCGGNLRVNAVNVDIRRHPGVDEVVNLSEFPWPWKDESIDGIYASHIMEHFSDQEKFLSECHRILKRGAFLRLNLPHASSVSSIGCMGHYRTYSYSSVHDYLAREGFYLCKNRRFKTRSQRLNWWYEAFDAQDEVPLWMAP